MTNKHTPGPWEIHPVLARIVPLAHIKRPLGCHVDAEKDLATYAQEICAMHWPDRNRSESEVRANARLIAAAPDLLAALKQALRYIEVRTAYQGAMTAAEVEEAIVGPLAPDVIEIGANSCNTLATFDFSAARAAIAKATWEG